MIAWVLCHCWQKRTRLQQLDNSSMHLFPSTLFGVHGNRRGQINQQRPHFDHYRAVTVDHRQDVSRVRPLVHALVHTLVHTYYTI